MKYGDQLEEASVPEWSLRTYRPPQWTTRDAACSDPRTYR